MKVDKFFITIKRTYVKMRFLVTRDLNEGNKPMIKSL